jgi:genome maintenance exonuclease 1
LKTHIAHPEIAQLVRVNIDGKRWYQTPEGKRYPSVTSVTSYASKGAIQEWRNKVGHAEADKISARASNRGTRVHSLCEDYLNNKEVIPQDFDLESWRSIKPELDFIDNIHGNEIRLYSDLLEVAGTADCIADYKGVLSIIDFKTSNKLKRKEWITNYFQQAAFYSLAFRERTGLSAKQIVIIILVDDELPQVFVEPVQNWLLSAKQCRDDFRKATGQ